MGRWALIKDSKVRNVIKAEADFAAKISAAWDATVDVSDLDPQPAIGWDYDGTNFTSPPLPPPRVEAPGEVVKREARERVEAIKRGRNVPIQGQALQSLLTDIIEVLF